VGCGKYPERSGKQLSQFRYSQGRVKLSLLSPKETLKIPWWEAIFGQKLSLR
jgi:hypothetical protein